MKVAFSEMTVSGAVVVDYVLGYTHTLGWNLAENNPVKKRG